MNTKYVYSSTTPNALQCITQESVKSVTECDIDCLYLGGVNLNRGNTTMLIASEMPRNIQDNFTLEYIGLVMST